MRSATVRQLQIFSVAASHLSFARAAEKLHLTHAAISLQIKQLEDVCGTQLFDRIGKKVFLTEAGEILLDHARQILQSLKDADESLMALKGLKGGRVTIAVTSTAEYFAPGLLAEFRKAQADVRVRLLVDNREEVSRMLISNEVDLAIMGRPPADMEAEGDDLCAASVRDRRRRRSSAGRAHRADARRHRAGDDDRARGRLGNPVGDGRLLPRARDRAEHRHGDGQQRGDQAGGCRRTGHQLHLAAHARAGTQRRSAGRAAGRGHAGDAPLVPRASQEQAPDAGARCLLGFRPRICAGLPQAPRASSKPTTPKPPSIPKRCSSSPPG
jgi:DNA-binding transcriptional LysR family regulator